MKQAYLGWIDRDGLKGFQPETESVDRFLNRLRHQHDRNTVGIRGRGASQGRLRRCGAGSAKCPDAANAGFENAD